MTMPVTELKLKGTDEYFTQEAFNVLRTNIQFCGQDIRTIAITSCTMNEGKTYTSLHLGRSLSEIGNRVLVLDADMRKSALAGRNTTAKNPKGLSEVLIGKANLSECVFKTQYQNLDILFAGQYPPNPVKLLESDYFGALLDAARKAYDYVIVDTPPLGMVIDAAVIAAKCDGAVLVIGSNQVKYPQANEVISQLKKAGCNVLGAVLNNAERKGNAYYRRKKYAYGNNAAPRT